MKVQPHSLIQLCLKRVKAVSDKIRWTVIEMLMDGPKTVGELAKELGVEHSLLSHHLKILRNGGLVESSRAGKSVICKLTDAVAFSDAGWELDLGCCRLEKAASTPLASIFFPPVKN
ncbi:MAG: metalloregulator ArsR/SmtB family transcription factor [Syntrophales bacterium]|nr:metalloregulator ArsR/SmtB family transcription factor [Syntrophales bacterium]MDD5643425.1 metalloregulator ArsR/SmtB family transcription factor [Syntrophales bacterium]